MTMSLNFDLNYEFIVLGFKYQDLWHTNNEKGENLVSIP